ncbi:TPA: hypothetical protein ACK0CK_002633 [Staphylococcus aureus]
MKESLLLVIFNRKPFPEEIEVGIKGRMVDSVVLSDDERFEEFIESEESQEYDFNVTTIHQINETGHIIGMTLNE